MGMLNEICSQLNLRWAWEKVRNASIPGDVWFDEIEISNFELNLDENLYSISQDIKNKTFTLNPIKPMPFPKQKDAEGNQKVRQYFHISIRDQVAWVAIVNVLGPHIDYKMPNWSYGNRLFRSIWVEENQENGKKKRKIGRYRHSSGRIYLPFKQSWPIYRRHIYLTTRAMTDTNNQNNLSDDDLLESQLVESLKESEKCKYLANDYWKTNNKNYSNDKLYWCSIDFEKFYPSIKSETVILNILHFLDPEHLDDIKILLSKMLSFKIDFEGLSYEELEWLNLKKEDENFNHIPTGLHVAGFLANTALLKTDKKVEEMLSGNKTIAHFRFVDDHIILSYKFDDLIDWVKKYTKIVEEENIGTKINHEKTEPKELSDLLQTESFDEKGDSYSKSEKACMLDPEFPSPLMTKTLALVSGIGKTNFSLMEEKELSALVDQLEHMLLVELPETEIPEKTRLAFAATRLAKLAENKLENHLSPLTNLSRDNNLDNGINNHEKSTIESSYSEQMIDIARIFSLIKKVLRDRPDRVRLWTRAILLCRQTGLTKLNEIVKEIQNISSVNELSADYLTSNTLSLLGSSALLASKIICDIDSADWKKFASMNFLNDLSTINLDKIKPRKNRHELIRSWEQFCFGVYCASINLKESQEAKKYGEINLPKSILNFGENCLEKENATDWAWWASRTYLNDHTPHADTLTIELGKRIVTSRDAIKYWHFYPYDVPETIIKELAYKHQNSDHGKNDQGWWYEVLKKNENIEAIDWEKVLNKNLKDTKSNLKHISNSKTCISLYDWVDFTDDKSIKYPSDPRISEWTALEIVKQIAKKITEQYILDKNYISKNSSQNEKNAIHPANYKIPKKWLEGDSLSWNSWKKIIEQERLTTIDNEFAIEDSRYSPIKIDTGTINSIRGLGIILFCLLKKSFELPSLWNGYGQTDILRLLPKLLLKRLTCSSYTLGILQSCLNSRVTENIVRSGDKEFRQLHFDDDTEKDPVSFIQISDLLNAIELSQNQLNNFQLSTLNEQARQLTPVDLKLLTEPNWKDIFHTGLTDND